MKKERRVWGAAAVVTILAGGLLFVTGPADAQPGAQAAAQAAAQSILILTDAIEKADGDAVTKGIAQANGHGLLPIMQGFGRRDAKVPGIGFGLNAGAFNPNGIEAQIMGMAKKELNADAIRKQQAETARAANVAAAIAEVTALKFPGQGGPKGRADWLRWSQDMKVAATALADAAGKGDGPAIKAAASKLNASCNNCHSVFRDS